MIIPCSEDAMYILAESEKKKRCYNELQRCQGITEAEAQQKLGGREWQEKVNEYCVVLDSSLVRGFSGSVADFCVTGTN